MLDIITIQIMIMKRSILSQEVWITWNINLIKWIIWISFHGPAFCLKCLFKLFSVKISGFGFVVIHVDVSFLLNEVVFHVAV